ncbi:MAG: hypothetical protein FWG30_03225 [Eubacteriaceae bacterium]|nr:hypothetical protein [Eubacteriaceae bacterium]
MKNNISNAIKAILFILRPEVVNTILYLCNSGINEWLATAIIVAIVFERFIDWFRSNNFL